MTSALLLYTFIFFANTQNDAQAAVYHSAANYRCNEFSGYNKTRCLFNQERQTACQGFKGMERRSCMQANTPSDTRPIFVRRRY